MDSSVFHDLSETFQLNFGLCLHLWSLNNFPEIQIPSYTNHHVLVSPQMPKRRTPLCFYCEKITGKVEEIFSEIYLFLFWKFDVGDSGALYNDSAPYTISLELKLMTSQIHQKSPNFGLSRYFPLIGPCYLYSLQTILSFEWYVIIQIDLINFLPISNFVTKNH